MAGQDVGRADVDGMIYNLSLAIRDLMTRAERLELWNSQTSQAVLEAAPYNYSADEAYAIKALLDRAATARVWLTGGAAPTEVHDLRPDLAAFTGLSL